MSILNIDEDFEIKIGHSNVIVYPKDCFRGSRVIYDLREKIANLGIEYLGSATGIKLISEMIHDDVKDFYLFNNHHVEIDVDIINRTANPKVYEFLVYYSNGRHRPKQIMKIVVVNTAYQEEYNEYTEYNEPKF